MVSCFSAKVPTFPNYLIGKTIIFSTHAQQIVQKNLTIHTHTKNEPLPHTVYKN